MAAFLLAVTVLAAVAPWTARAAGERGETPLLAYYYIWFEPSSWNRAKTDYPLLGRYSSDERTVMREHVRAAKSAGIDGFIVSWKSTPTLDRRLERLIAVAEQQDFKLSIIYQGLDFHRDPLPVERVAADLERFERRYAGAGVFEMFEKPLVIWSGTWKFSRRDVARTTRAHRRRLLMLASEKNVKGFERLADVVDGDAYYWSSVNPDTFPNYPAKLAAMGQSVHARGGLWIAPAAPGFDARLLGGKTIVERKGGETLVRELDAATRSSPDAIGLISWNEFSENSHVEPSRRFGRRYLDVLADRREARLPVGDLDSSEPGTSGSGYGLALLVAFALLVVGSLATILLRGRRRPGAPRQLD